MPYLPALVAEDGYGFLPPADIVAFLEAESVFVGRLLAALSKRSEFFLAAVVVMLELVIVSDGCSMVVLCSY